MSKRLDASRIVNQLVEVSKILPHPDNPNTHPDTQIAQLAASHEAFGQYRSVVLWARPDGRYIQVAGHGYLEGARREGATEIRADILPEDTDPVTIKAILVADNLHAQNSVTDEEVLVQLLTEQADAGYDLAMLGSDDETLRQMLASLGDGYLACDESEEGEEDGDEESAINPDEIEIRCKSGEIWQLGEHRLLVGDCTNANNIKRLMQSRKAALVVTSPPYTDQREYGLGSFDWNALMCDSFDQIIVYVEDDAHILINLGLSHKNRQVDMYWNDWLKHCADRGWPLFGWYTWDKGAGMPGDWSGRLAPAHEFVFHFNQKTKQPNKWIETLGRDDPWGNRGFRQKDGTLKPPTSPDKFGQPYKVPDSVIRINRELSRGIYTDNHPAVYPVALPEFVMKTWSKECDIVYEPFCGSGTTIIAAEKLNRQCYACEIDVKYASVILARWEKHTGQTATLLERVEEAVNV